MLIRADYKKKIDNSEWVNERISEVFDDATDMMSENAVVFGGVIRDALAGQELNGDIDIAVNMNEYRDLVLRFQKSVKWISHHKSFQKGFQRTTSGAKMGGPVKMGGSGGGPNYKKWFPKLNDVASFVHMNGCIAQIVSVNTEETYSMVRDVDIVCCGVIMSYDGQVFEVVEGAYEDCKAKVLRLNKIKSVVNLSETPNRITKLVARGWKSLVTKKQLDRILAKHKNDTNNKLKELAKHPTHQHLIHSAKNTKKQRDGVPGYATYSNNANFDHIQPSKKSTQLDGYGGTYETIHVADNIDSSTIISINGANVAIDGGDSNTTILGSLPNSEESNAISGSSENFSINGNLESFQTFDKAMSINDIGYKYSDFKTGLNGTQIQPITHDNSVEQVKFDPAIGGQNLDMIKCIEPSWKDNDLPIDPISQGTTAASDAFNMAFHPFKVDDVGKEIKEQREMLAGKLYNKFSIESSKPELTTSIIRPKAKKRYNKY